MEIYQRFKKLRKFLNLTQKEMAEAIGKKDYTIIQKYEYGTAKITDGVLLNLQRKFDVNIDWLRTGEGEMFIKKEDNKNKRYDFLLKMLDDFSDEELAEIIKTTQTMVDKKNNKMIINHSENIG